jgi:hypothetical protein
MSRHHQTPRESHEEVQEFSPSSLSQLAQINAKIYQVIAEPPVHPTTPPSIVELSERSKTQRTSGSVESLLYDKLPSEELLILVNESDHP